MLRQPINATDRCSKSPPGAFPCSLRIVGLWLLAALAAGPGLFAAQYDPGPGKTISLIGQTFQQEYLDYANGTGLTPAGSSHYATFFLGAIEQGDDDPNSRFLDFVIDNNLGEYALVALSLKDNTAAGGYGQMVDDQGPNFNANAIWEALRDVTSGRWDSQIDAFANILSSRPNTKFYLRIGYETSIMLFANQSERYVIDVVNGYANQGINAFENADTIPEWDLDAYPDAYNYIADRIRRVGGVSNVDFVYHPVRGFWDAFWLYPGGSFVDWVALSVFNNDVCLPVGSTTNCSGQSVDPNLQQVLDWARGTLGKPLMIAEATAQVPAANTSGGFNDYLNRLHNLVVANDVRVLAYINSDWPAHGWPPDIWGDSRVEARGSSVLNTYLNLFGSSRYIHFGGGGNPPPPPPPGGCASDAVDFDDGVGSYSSQDSSNGSVSVEDGGCALALSGNRWIGTDATFDVTADTVLEFTFSSTSQGEIHGIGFDEDSSISNDPRVFQIHGTQNWGSAIDGFDYTGGTQTFSIPVGQFYTGNSMRLVFVNDKDSGAPNNTGRFSNVRVSGGGGPPPPPPGTIPVPGVVTTNLGNLANGSTASWEVDVTAGGDLTVAVTSTSSQNSQLIDIVFGGRSLVQAIDAGQTLNAPFPGISNGPTTLSITAQSPAVSIGRVEVTGSGSPPPPPPPPPGGCASDAVDFDDGVSSYSSQDSSNGSVSVEDGGCALALSGNRWIGTDATFDVTADTVLEFTFSSTSQGEIHGIGFDEDSSISNDPRVFQIHGTQNWGSAIDGFDYTGGTQTFSIPVGQFYTGNSMRLVFVNDKDSGTPNNTGRFSNVRVSGGGSPPPPPPPPGGLAKLEPSTGQTLLIVGQDLQTVSEYIGSGCCPTPGGITTYVAFYSLLDPNFPQWGALGEDPNGNPNNIDIDWGAGPLNARNAAIGFPDSTLQMGLSIAEGNRGTGETWAPGGIAQIAAGQRDGEIDRLARFFNSISGVPVYLRVGYEFDGQWNLGYENRSNFVAAYRRIVDGLRARGVNNVAYVWQSSSSPIDDILDGFRENLADWYPGDDYVDWVGMSWFLLPDEQALVGGTVSTQRQLGEEILSFARGRGKPVMIAEASPQGYHLSGGFNAHISPVWDGTSAQGQVSKSGNQIWNEWYVPFLSFIRSNGDVIKAVSYINTFWDSQASWGPPYNEGFWGDARVQVNTTVRNRWDSEMSSSFWLHGGPSLFSILGL